MRRGENAPRIRRRLFSGTSFRAHGVFSEELKTRRGRGRGEGPSATRMGWNTVFAAQGKKCRIELDEDEKTWSLTARLVRDAQEGDREAFGRLAEQFERTVYAICLGRLGNASEALEMTQEVFLHAMRHLEQLREPERFAGWLKQMTHRMAINRATRRVPPSTIEDEVLEGLGGRREDRWRRYCAGAGRTIVGGARGPQTDGSGSDSLIFTSRGRAWWRSRRGGGCRSGRSTAVAYSEGAVEEGAPGQPGGCGGVG